MNALELAEECQDGYPLAPDAIAAAALLRRQHDAIRVLREALTELSGMYVVHHNAATRAKQALKDTEEIAK